MEIQEEKVMWIRKIGLGILIGVVLCSVMVNAEERNSRKAEPMTVMERMREIPHKIYGKKKSRNKMRKVPGKFKLPPDASIGDIIKTKSGYKQIIDIWGNGKFRLKSLEKKYYRQRKTRVKKRYN